jgi:hypothetical protein
MPCLARIAKTFRAYAMNSLRHDKNLRDPSPIREVWSAMP